MKKVVVFFVCVVMLFTLSACGFTATEPATSTSSSAQSGNSKVEITKAPAVESTPKPTTEPTPTPAPTPAPEQFKPLEVKEFGYSINRGYLYYSICIHNPNESFFVEFPTFRVTARDASNVLLGTEDQVLFSIYPQQDVWHAFMGFKVDEEPASVSVEMLMPKDYNIKKISSVKQPTYIPLTAINYAQRGDKIVGEIKNDNDYEISQAIVTVVYRDKNGNLLGGDSTFVDSIPANGTAPFEKSTYTSFSDVFEVYVGRWDY